MKMPVTEEKLPVTPLGEVLPTRVELTLLEPLAEVGNVTLLEVMVIASLAQRAAPSVVFEIGTFDGRTTLNMAANMGSSGQVYTLDLPRAELGKTQFELASGERTFVDKQESGAKFSGTSYAGKITQLYGDSATSDFDSYKGQMGLVFVDGSHTEEYVRQDSATALRLVADGGVILWHDYQQDWPGVIRGLSDLYETDPDFAGMRKIEGTTLVILRREDSRR